MAMSDHTLGYRAETTAALQAELATLKGARTTFIQQSIGTKSFQRDLRLMEERIQAVNYVLRERGAITITKPAINVGVGVMDFSSL
jgi:hypothetical protein